MMDSDSETPPENLLQRHRWMVFVLPFLVYMVLGTLEPKQPGSYPVFYTVRIAVTIAVILFVLPGYREFPFRISPLSVGVGVVGIVLWIGLCWLNLEQRLLEPLGLGMFIDLGQRPAYNPFDALGQNGTMLAGFLAVRFLGLAVLVPLIEEFFLRGFLMRFVVDTDWWKVPFGTSTMAALVTCTVYGILTHPTELFAAIAWFSLISWLMVKTRNIWDCVAAHAVTNLLLGIYVVTWQDWSLW